jgi:hypothetical protein
MTGTVANGHGEIKRLASTAATATALTAVDPDAWIARCAVERHVLACAQGAC